MMSNHSPVTKSSDPDIVAALLAADFSMEFKTDEAGNPFAELHPSRALDTAGDPSALAGKLPPRPDTDNQRASQIVSTGFENAVRMYQKAQVDAAIREAHEWSFIANEAGESKYHRDILNAAQRGDISAIRAAGQAAQAWVSESRERAKQAQRDLRFLRSR